MTTYSLAGALKSAAQHVHSKLGSLDTPDARARFCEEFLQRWLVLSDDPLTLNPTEASGSYFFLLWKNLSVTNISVSELTSLLRLHSRSRKTGKLLQVDFLTTEDYKAFLNNLWQSVFSERGKSNRTSLRIRRAVNDIIAFHSNFFDRTIIFDTYFTSALVFIPRSIKVDIGAVTIQSGYVHSAGIAIYFRNIEKADRELFRVRMDRFLKMQRTKKFFVTPYASELFAPYEGRSSVSIRNGLDGVRIQLRKHYFESESLPNFLLRLKKLFPRGIIIPRGISSYDDDRARSLADGADPEVSIWFVTDAGVKFDPNDRIANKSKDLFIITYAQTHLNHSQFNIFKERKPAWVSSTTLPHSLSAAMVNITRHYHHLNNEKNSSKSAKVVVLDPFCGTGTTLFDAATRIPNAIVIGLDRSPVMPALVRNNALFLSTPSSEIAAKLSMLRSIESYLRRKIDEESVAQAIQEIRSGKHIYLQPPRTSEQEFEYCLWLLIGAMNARNGEISDASVAALAQEGFTRGLLARMESAEFPLQTRIVFYALWRALMMNTFSIRPEAITPQGIFRVFLKEIDLCIKEYDDLSRLLKRKAHPLRGRTGSLKSTWDACVGTYSLEGRLNPGFFSERGKPVVVDQDIFGLSSFRSWKPGTYICQVADSIEKLAGLKPFADIILSDPPFGFNEFDSESREMRDLYAKMVPTLVNVLRPGGQLIIALPAFAKNGKQIPFYQTRESVTKQIIAHVEAADRKILRNVESFPADRAIFSLPWYWGTASTIERRIIHFVIR